MIESLRLSEVQEGSVFIVAMVGILLAMFVVIVRALSVHGLFDRILAVNVFGTITVLFITVFGFMTARPEFLDIALLYALINFIVTIGMLRFVEYGSLGINDRHSSGH